GDFIVGDGETLSFPDASFDVVYSFGVLHHAPDTAGAVREIHRVLKKDGTAIVMLYHRSSLLYWGSFVLKHGIFGGELFKESMSEILSRRVESSVTGGRPLVKVFSRTDARRMFRDFSEIKFHINQLTRHELRPAGRVMPEAMFQWIARHFGWNLVITATK